MKKIQLLPVLVFCLMVQGCSILHTVEDVKIQEDEIGRLGQAADVSAILDILGPPARLSALPGGFVFLYEQITFYENQFGIGSSHDFFQFFKFSLAKVEADQQLLVVFFDHDGLVTSFDDKIDRESLGRGSSLQFITGLKNLVSYDGYFEDMNPNLWGMALTRPIPRVLNMQQSMEQGHAGVEQAGVSGSVGQHTLEMR